MAIWISKVLSAQRALGLFPLWGKKGGYGHDEYPDADQAIRYVEGGPMVGIAEVEVDKIPYAPKPYPIP